MTRDHAAAEPRRFRRCLAHAPPGQPRSDTERFTTSVDAIFFDLDGVLYDDTLGRRWLLQLLGRFGLHADYTAFFRAWDRACGDDVAWGNTSYWTAMKTFLVSAGLSPSQAAEVEAAARAKLRQSERDIRPFPHVLSALRQLSLQGLLLGVCASLPWTPAQLADRLHWLGMTDLFRVTRSARDWPRHIAPQERLARTLTQVGRRPERTAYVGRRRHELLAAAQLGMPCVAFNPEPDASAHFHLGQFDQLVDMIPNQSVSSRAAG